MTLYQLTLSPSRLTQAMNEILLTWQETDSLLLLGSSGVLAEKIIKTFPQFDGKLLVLENTNFTQNSIKTISHEDWVNLAQRQVITLDFS